MDGFLRRLTDLGLRRIYKFVLKSTIGRFLADELQIEQLEVRSGDGVVVLKDLELQANVINGEILRDSPVQVRSVAIDEIRVHLSYSTLFEDSLKFEVNCLDLVIEPNLHARRIQHPELNRTSLDESGISEADRTQEPEPPMMGEESLQYIAYWVHVVVAKLRAVAHTVNVTIVNPAFAEADHLALQLQFKEVSFFNTDPNSFEGSTTSLELSSMIMSGAKSDVASNLGATKVVTVSSISVLAGSSDPVLTLDGLLRAKLRVDPSCGAGVDLDVDIPRISVDLAPRTIAFLMDYGFGWAEALRKLSSSSQVASTLPSLSKSFVFGSLQSEDLLLLQRRLQLATSADKDGQSVEFSNRDLAAIIQLLRKHSLGPPASLPKPQVMAMDTVVSDDEAFPDNGVSSDSDGDEDFFDARSAPPSYLPKSSFLPKSRAATSLMHRSSSGMQSRVHFADLAGSKPPEPQDDNGGNSEVSLRLHIKECSITFSISAGSPESSGREQLHMHLCDIVVTAAHTANSSTCHLAIAMIEVTEETTLEAEASKKWIVSFHSGRANKRSIYSSPHFNLDLSATTETRISVALEPMIASFSPSQISKWADAISKAIVVRQTPVSSAKREPSRAVHVSLSAPDILVFVQSDNDIRSGPWHLFNQALRLDVVSDCWDDMLLDPLFAPCKKHFQGGPGGLLVNCGGVRVEFWNGSSASPSEIHDQGHTTQMNSASFSIFLPLLEPFSLSAGDGVRYMRSKLLVASGDSQSAIVVTQASSSSPGKLEDGRISQQSSVNGSTLEEKEEEDIGPAAPVVDTSRLIQVSACHLEAIIHQREFNALLMIFDVLSKGEAKADGNATFGLKILTKSALIVLSENVQPLFESVRRNDHGFAFDALCCLLHQLRKEYSPPPSADAFQPLTLCVAIKDPMFEFYAVDRDLFVAMKANDFSMFEMTPSQFKLLQSAQFDFHGQEFPAQRMGPQRHQIPFIHRASTPTVTYKAIQKLKGSQLARAATASSSAGVSLLGDHGRIGHAFEVKLALSASGNGEQLTGARSVHLFVDVYDIMWNHDPASTWLLKLVNFLTPKPPSELIELETEDLAREISALRDYWQHDDEMLTKIQQQCDAVAPTGTSFRNSGKPQAESFEMMKILVRVRESVINYCDEADSSLAALSVGLLTLYSTVVSSSARFVLKVGVKDLSMQIAPLTATGPLKLSAVLEINHITTMIRVKDVENEDLSLKFDIGNCVLHGCMDSLQLVVKTMQRWFNDFQTACAQSERIIRGKHIAGEDELGLTGEEAEVDRVRTCLDAATIEGEALQQAMNTVGLLAASDDTDEEGEGETTNPKDSPRNRLAAEMERSALGASIKENFFGFGQEQDPSAMGVEPASWIPDYNFDQDTFHLDDFADVLQMNPTSTENEDNHDGQEPSLLQAAHPPRPLESYDYDDDDDGTAASTTAEGGHFAHRTFTDREVELHSLRGDSPTHMVVASEPLNEQLESDEAQNLEDIDRAWADDEASFRPTFSSERSQETEVEPDQQAKWYTSESERFVRHNYIPTNPPSSWTSRDPRSDQERPWPLDLALNLTGNLQIRFFAGSEWDSGSAESARGSYVELSAKDARLWLFQFTEPEDSDASEENTRPKNRIQVTVQDWLLTFGGAERSQRRKLVGLWHSPSRPRDALQPAISVSLIGYMERSTPIEYRMKVAVLPLRCHLTSEFLDFSKKLMEHANRNPSEEASAQADQPAGSEAQENSGACYFQIVDVSSTELKIDYHASHVNLKALREGDFLQLLNILPIDGLELRLRGLRFKGVSGTALGRKLAESWVRDIYTTQLHRLFSGTAPLKGLYNVGADLSSLLFLPKSKYGSYNHPGLLKELRSQTSVLARTVARETLDLSHKLTRFVACTITDLASERSAAPKPAPHVQPRGVAEGLQQAYSVIRNEISETAETIVAVPIRQYEQLGPSGLLTEVVRALPIAILKPLGGLAHGLSYTILGLRNDIDPAKKSEEEDIYHIDFEH